MVQRLLSMEKGSSFIAVIRLAMEYIYIYIYIHGSDHVVFPKMKLEIMSQDSRL
jgi:hypothetical protein